MEILPMTNTEKNEILSSEFASGRYVEVQHLRENIYLFFFADGYSSLCSKIDGEMTQNPFYYPLKDFKRLSNKQFFVITSALDNEMRLCKFDNRINIITHISSYEEIDENHIVISKNDGSKHILRLFDLKMSETIQGSLWDKELIEFNLYVFKDNDTTYFFRIADFAKSELAEMTIRVEDKSICCYSNFGSKSVFNPETMKFGPWQFPV